MTAAASFDAVAPVKSGIDTVASDLSAVAPYAIPVGFGLLALFKLRKVAARLL